MRSNSTIISPWEIIFFSVVLFLCASTSIHAMNVTLEWDANTEPDLAGYKVYYGNESRHPDNLDPYNSTGSPITVLIGNPGDPNNLNDPNNPEFTVKGLDNDKVYFFAVTAYDTEGLESDYSNEVNTSSVSPFPVRETSGGGDGGGCAIAKPEGKARNALLGLVGLFGIVWLLWRRKGGF